MVQESASWALVAYRVEADHVKVWQTVGKLRRRHGLVMSGKPREPGESRQAGYTVKTWGYVSRRRLRDSLARWERNPQLALFDRLREAKWVRSTVKGYTLLRASLMRLLDGSFNALPRTPPV